MSKSQFVTFVVDGDELLDPQIEPDESAVSHRAEGCRVATDGKMSVVAVPLDAIKPLLQGVTS